MKTKLSIIVAVILFAGNGLYAVPTDKIFTSSGHILPGEEWANVFIYNDGTLVNMLGGDVDSIGTYDASMVNVTGGSVSTLDALEFSIANITGGYAYSVFTRYNSTVNFSGNANSVSLGVVDSGIVNMAGGTTTYLRAGNISSINLYGGIVSEYLNAWDSATVNIYGYGFNYDPSAGSWDGGQLTGFWLDDTPFTIDLYDAQTYNHINLIPEPATVLLMSLGSLILRRRRNNKAIM